MIKNIKEPSDAHKNTLKEEILQEITENFMEKILDMVKQNVQDALKKFQDTKIKNVKTQKQIKEHRENFKKHQSGKRGEK
jgi:cell division ATPase FtsA